MDKYKEALETIQAFEALKRNDMNALLADIGSAVKPYYDDFMESRSDSMDVELGEIYRETLNSVFKALIRKGVII